MGLLLKGKEDKLTVQFKGDGPAKQILATANASGVQFTCVGCVAVLYYFIPVYSGAAGSSIQKTTPPGAL